MLLYFLLWDVNYCLFNSLTFNKKIKKINACLTSQELLQLEEDVKLLEEVYPQGEQVRDH